MKRKDWTNYDTYKVFQLLRDINSNYYKIIGMTDDEVVMLTIGDLQRHFDLEDDDIDFDQVDVDEIIENIMEGRYENIQHQR
jgi:hypothetical protein